MLKRVYSTVVVSVLLLTVLGSSTVNAISRTRLESLINNRPFYDANSCVVNGAQTDPVPNDNNSKGPVYIVGDSITEQTKKLYESAISGVFINASSGRSITGKGTTGNRLSGLEAVEADSETIIKSGTVIVALGTNGNNDSLKIGQMIEKIRGINKDAIILWVDTMVIGRSSYVGVINSSNKAIYGNSSARNYSVVSWAKTVSPDADPQNLNGNEKDPNGYIRQADQYVHPTPAGEKALVKLVSSSVSGDGASNKTSQATTSQTSCAKQCSTTGTIPEGSENAERMFKYFISIGLTAAQAAGITGNAMTESGEKIDPTIVSPSGYRGIFQWDAKNRWPRLAAWALVKNRDPLAFETQLEYAHFEAEQRGNIEEIKKQSSVELATWYWGRFFEGAVIDGSTSKVPLTNVQHLDVRTNYARFVLDKYGGAFAVIGAQASSCVGKDPSGEVGEVVGEFAWPVDVQFWKDHPGWFTKPHHDYAASDIPVPTNTNIYSMTAGTVRLTSGGGCGTGAIVTVGNAQFTYCHGIPGSHKVSNGDKVVAGQMLFSSDNTGSSTGPHLHVQIKVGGVKHCPQELFKKMGAGETSIDLGSLPTSGCSY